MASVSALRLALRSSSKTLFRPTIRISSRSPVASTTSTSRLQRSTFSTSCLRRTGGHEEETFEEFTARYEKEFESVQDVFELQRNLNNAFAYDLVPAPSVIIAALKAARRVNDYPTAVRIFEGIRQKVENVHQYDEYLEELKGVREEMGVNLKEELYPGGTDSPHYNQ